MLPHHLKPPLLDGIKDRLRLLGAVHDSRRLGDWLDPAPLHRPIARVSRQLGTDRAGSLPRGICHSAAGSCVGVVVRLTPLRVLSARSVPGAKTATPSETGVSSYIATISSGI